MGRTLNLYWGFSWFLIMEVHFLKKISDIEKQEWDGLETLDTMFFELFDVHIIHYPKKIRDDCYTCIRLKSSAVGNKSREVNETISKIIPNLFSSNPHYEKSGKHFDEVGASNPRSASKIKL